MERIQYGIAGFFAGLFAGLLLALIERKFVSAEEHPAGLFFLIALTVIVCAIAGMIQALRMHSKKYRKP